MRLPDATATPPVRRMAVARGRLKARPAAVEATRKEGGGALAAARAAALLAAKDQGRLVPTALPVQLTDAFCDLATGADFVEATVTVQGHARVPLEGPALAGVAAALLSLLDAMGGSEAAGASIGPIEVVQNVVA